jgi:hypothetical protein
MSHACKRNEMRLVLVAKHEGKRLLGRSRHRWEDSINLNKYNGRVDWIHVAQDRDQWLVLMNTVMNLSVP